MKKVILLSCIILWLAGTVFGQRADYSKMSSWVRRLVMEQAEGRAVSQRKAPAAIGKVRTRQPELCAFVQVTADAPRVFLENNCRQLARFGNIYIVGVPLQDIARLSSCKQVRRIEARRGNSLHMDSVALQLNTWPAYEGQAPLPQAYTGKGVVVGVQDIGFDLTHPNFYNASATKYRIKRFWDQLSTDTVGSSLYVGAAYEGRDALLAYQHSRDGLRQTHGTHTLGIAAGSGYNSKYRGMAYESDICIVSNAVTEDAELIDSADYYKYTYATDALGFKFIMDYATERNLPCVVSFSEGSCQDFRGDDLLYYAVLDSLSGPGRIIVASAGNEGAKKSYFKKAGGQERAGTFVYGDRNTAHLTLKSAQPFAIRLAAYGDTVDSLTVTTPQILACADSQYIDTVRLGQKQYILNMTGYPSCYHPEETAYDVMIQTNGDLGVSTPFSLEVQGAGSEVEAYRVSGYWTENHLNPLLNAGEQTHNVHSPSSAPSVICVGATSYRTGFTNYLGKWHQYDQGTHGQRGDYSSVGPTYDGRVKPDVMAPGTNIISSYSSYYIEANPNASDVESDIAHFDFNGRQYAWNSNAGTSMATPAVAGAIALWLQAKPSLTREELMDVFAHTCTQYDPALPSPNNLYGYGQIDVYKGLLYILGVNGIEGITDHQPTAIQFGMDGGGRLTMAFTDTPHHSFTVALYATSGALLAKRRYPAGQPACSWDLSALPHGVYIIQVNSQQAGATGSTLVRR